MARLSTEQREEIWHVLSDAFVDNEVSFEYIARRVGDIDIQQLKDIFFKEVAPVCGTNLLTAIPPIWTEFEKDKIVKQIREKLSIVKKSPFAWYKYVAFVIYSRWFFKDLWSAIVDAIEKKQLK